MHFFFSYRIWWPYLAKTFLDLHQKLHDIWRISNTEGDNASHLPWMPKQKLHPKKLLFTHTQLICLNCCQWHWTMILSKIFQSEPTKLRIFHNSMSPKSGQQEWVFEKEVKILLIPCLIIIVLHCYSSKMILSCMSWVENEHILSPWNFPLNKSQDWNNVKESKSNEVHDITASQKKSLSLKKLLRCTLFWTPCYSTAPR